MAAAHPRPSSAPGLSASSWQDNSDEDEDAYNPDEEEDAYNPDEEEDAYNPDEEEDAYGPDEEEDGYDNRVKKRCVWLGANVFDDRAAISDEAVKMLSRIEFGRAMEITKDLEARGREIRNPSGYLMSAVSRELGCGPSHGSTQKDSFSDEAFHFAHRACTRIGAEFYNDKKVIDLDAIRMLAGLDADQANDILRNLEENSSEVANPNNWIKAAVSRCTSGGTKRGRDEDEQAAFSKMHKRCTWLGVNVFDDSQIIDEEAIRLLSRLDHRRAMEITKDIQAQGKEIRNPSGYIKKAVKSTQERGTASFDGGNKGSGRSSSNADGPDNFHAMHKACTRIGAEIFNDREAIDLDAIRMLADLDEDRANNILRDLEGKGSKVSNPNSWIKAAVSREFGHRDGGDERGHFDAMHKFCTRLGAEVFDDREAIDLEAIRMLADLDEDRARHILGDLEGKGSKVTNPSGWIKVAVSREFGNRDGRDGPGNFNTMHKACTRIGAEVFNDRAAIDLEVIRMLADLNFDRANDILRHLEEKGSEVSNPNKWLKGAISREWEPETLGTRDSWDEHDNFHAMHKACTRIGAEVFNDRKAIDLEAIQMLAGLDADQTNDILSHLEEKGSEVANPSGWIKAAITRRERGHNEDEHAAFSKMHKRCTWLGVNVFDDSQIIDEEAIRLLSRLDHRRAMEITKDIQAQGKEIRNPSGYIKKAVKSTRERETASFDGRNKGSGRSSSNPDGPDNFHAMHKACTRIGAEIFNDREAINLDAIRMLADLDEDRANYILGDLEGKGSKVSNPSGWIKVAVSREFGHRDGGDGRDKFHAMHKFCTRLGAEVFDDREAIDLEAIRMLADLDEDRARHILGDLEGKGSKVTNPSGWIKVAVSREFGNRDGRDGRGNFNTMHKACTRIGAEVFNDRAAIDLEVIRMLADLDFDRANDILRHLEEKGSEVSNPSSWIKDAISKGTGRAAKRGHNEDDHAVSKRSRTRR